MSGSYDLPFFFFFFPLCVASASACLLACLLGSPAFWSWIFSAIGGWGGGEDDSAFLVTFSIVTLCLAWLGLVERQLMLARPCVVLGWIGLDWVGLGWGYVAAFRIRCGEWMVGWMGAGR